MTSEHHDSNSASPLQVLHALWLAAGGDAAALDRVRLTGADPALPSTFRVGTAAQATIAATGLAAAEIWRQRTNRTQAVATAIRQAMIV